jgi:purine-nucleoside phosphorylase
MNGGAQAARPDVAAQVEAAASYIRGHWTCRPRVGIVLGTGLAAIAEEMRVTASLDYASIPNFLQPTALGHKGSLACGTIGGLPVMMMGGRFHRYEGHPLSQVTLPVRVMKKLGIELLILSNASGGLNPGFLSGDIVVVDDHINLLHAHPLLGQNDVRLGARHPDFSRPYDRQLIESAQRVARRAGFTCQRGVYAAMTGPNYETRAEYRFLRRIGADVVGMSTVPEVLVAVQARLRVLALSAVTNLCRPDILQPTSGHAVIEAARMAEPKMRQIVLGVLKAEFGRPE